MAADLNGHPHRRPPGAAVRGCAPVELRGVRLARAAAAVRPERLRRDPPGAVRVRRQADGGQLHHRRPQQRLRQGRHPGGDAGVGGGLPGGDGRLRRRWARWPSGTPTWTRTSSCRRSAAPPPRPPRPRSERRRPSGPRRRAEKAAAKARTRDSLQALSKLGELVDGQYRIVSQPPIVVPMRDLEATYGLSRRRDRAGAPRAVPRLPGHPARRSAPAAGAVRAGRHGPQGGRGGQRRHPGLHRPAPGPRPAGPAVPAGQGGDQRRSWRATCPRAATSSTASGWCTASG